MIILLYMPIMHGMHEALRTDSRNPLLCSSDSTVGWGIQCTGKGKVIWHAARCTPVQDDDLPEGGFLNLQLLGQVPEHGGHVWHDVA